MTPEQERDALIAEWPEVWDNHRAALWLQDDGSYLLNTADGLAWTKCHPGPYPDRESAVRAAAGISADEPKDVQP